MTTIAPPTPVYPRSAPQPCSVYDLHAGHACDQWARYRDRRSGMWLCRDHQPSVPPTSLRRYAP